MTGALLRRRTARALRRRLRWLAALPDEHRALVAARVRSFIASTPELAGRSEVGFPYETCVYWCERLTA